MANHRPSPGRNASGPSVPLHRRLGPTTPRKHSPSVTSANTTSPHNSVLKNDKIPIPIDAGDSQRAGPSGLQRRRSFSSDIADDPCLQATFVDGPLDPPLADPSQPSVRKAAPTKPSPREKHTHAPAADACQSAPSHSASESPCPSVAPHESVKPSDGFTMANEEETLKLVSSIRTPQKQYKTKRKEPSQDLQMETAGSISAGRTKGKGRPATTPFSEVVEAESGAAVENTDETTKQLLAQTIRVTRRKRSSVRKEPDTGKRARLTRKNGSTSAQPQENHDSAEVTSSITPMTASPQTTEFAVFAWWHADKSYYPGVVAGREGNKVRVNFLDGTHAIMTVDKLRRCELRKGDLIKPRIPIAKVTHGEVEVERDWPGGNEPIKVALSGEPIGSIPLEEILLRQAIVHKTFGDRMLPSGSLSIAAGSPLPRTLLSGQVSSVLAGKVFLITSPSHGRDGDDLKQFQTRIGNHGGRVEQDWRELFDEPGSFSSTLRNSDSPYLLARGGGPLMTVKTMVALAKGIPSLGAEYIDAVIQRVSVLMFALLIIECFMAGVLDHCWPV